MHGQPTQDIYRTSEEEEIENRVINHKWTSRRKKTKAVLRGTAFAQFRASLEASWLYWQLLRTRRKKCVMNVSMILHGYEDTPI